MNVRHVISWLCIVVPSLVILAAAILVGMNWGNLCTMSVYWRILHDVSIGLLMLFCAVGGVVAYFSVRILIRGIRGVRKVKLASQQTQQQSTQGERMQ